MRFMILVKATKDTEAGVMQPEKLIAEMATYHEELAKAGVLLDASGLQPSSKGWRIKYSGGKRTLIDGPFAETKELIAGYTIIQVKSKEEALERTKRFPNPAMKGRRDRGAPVVRAGGFRSQRGDRALSQDGGWAPPNDYWVKTAIAHSEETMKYICLGYFDEKKWETMSESEQNAFLDECFTYDDLLRKNGHIASGEALQSARNAITLRWKNGKVSITDGPYAETKEQLGGFGVFEARDLNHAIKLMSKHPAVKEAPSRFARLRTCPK